MSLHSASMHHRSRLTAAVLLAAAALPGAHGETVVAYGEAFPNPSGGPQPLAASGWSYFLGNEGHDQKDNAATASLVTPRAGAGGASGFLSNTLGPDGVGEDPFWNQFTHYATEEPSIDLAATPLVEVSVAVLLSQPDAFRFTARVDGRWFATREAVEPGAATGDAFASAARTHTLRVAGSSWVPLSFLPGTTMGLDTAAEPVPLPVGRLDAAGLLLQPTGHESFDDFELRVVEAPAEPD